VHRNHSTKFTTGPAGYLHKRYLYLDGTLVDVISQSLRIDSAVTIPLRSHYWFAGFFRRVAAGMSQSGSPSENTRQLSLLALELLMELGESAAAAQTPPAVRRAVEYMHRNIGRHLSLAEIARACDMSPFPLCRIFASAQGTPPLRYFSTRRIAHARSLLLDTDLSIKEIAASLGFDNPANFATLFRKTTGTSPRELRKRSQGGARSGQRVDGGVR
jgi:AraC-like DNA-binding protein